MSSDNLASTGIKGLDDVMRGGLPRERLYLIQGDPGVGKTTLALQFLTEGVRRGEKCLYVTLSESDLEIRQVAASHGWDLKGVEICELTAAEQHGSLADGNTLFVSSEIELTEATSTLLRRIEALGPSRVVIDSLSELRLLAQSALRYRRQILALKEYFLSKHATALLLDDRTNAQEDQLLQSLTHGVVALEATAPTYGTDRRRLRVVKLRGVPFRGGYHDYVIEKGGLQVFPRLVAADHLEFHEAKLLSSGLAPLDALLGGGLDRGTSTLIMGPAGTGKSVLAATYALAAAARGEKVATFLFDESIATMNQRAKSLGLPIADPANLFVRQIDPAEVSPGEFAACVQDRVDNHGAKLVIIDSLNGYLAAMPEERFLTIQMHELLTYLAHKGVATFLLMAQYGIVGTSMSTPIDMSYLADTVIMLRYFEAHGEVLKALSVVKKRSGPHERTIRQLSIEPGGLQVGEPLRGFQGILTGTPKFLGGNHAGAATDPEDA